MSGDGGLQGIVKDCVAFANAAGGRLLIGIEDDCELPPADQRISDELLERLAKRIPQLTLNVGASPRKVTEVNGGEYIELTVLRNTNSIAATSDGRYFILGLLAQYEMLTAQQLAARLDLKRTADVGRWLGRLPDWEIIKTRGRTRGREYYIAPRILSTLDFKGNTTLKGIEKHRLRELILRDLEIYEEAAISEIHRRIGLEIPRHKIRDELRKLVMQGLVGRRGERKARRYLLKKKA